MDTESVAVEQRCGAQRTLTPPVHQGLGFSSTFLRLRSCQVIVDAPVNDWRTLTIV